ncbi:hypothetical protein CA13_72390 [Planctomycetes bacterium CA13]|uniref:Uncharacterized protein n=1 Tax=Novipirellula herctigrandis TaxID=2527986 RepID=A0A5C5YP31_9BACT|nr:hypothetical protein CA13_72390 [Planctomycetes bacterium CA13]
MKDNPYEPPLHHDEPAVLRQRRSILLMIFAAGFGMTSFLVGLLVAAESIVMSQRQGFDVEIAKGCGVAFVFALLGVCWACSSRLYWMQRHRVANSVNVSVFVAAATFLLLLKLGIII